jgi:hypothetical protein
LPPLIDPPGYSRPRPERTLLYQLVEQHYPAYRELPAAADRPPAAVCAGITESPMRLTRSIKDALVNVTCGGAPATIWPGGGITVMVDVSRMPDNSFGTVPTPAIVAPIEFTMRLRDYADVGGHMEHVNPLGEVLKRAAARFIDFDAANAWPVGARPLLG